MKARLTGMFFAIVCFLFVVTAAIPGDENANPDRKPFVPWTD